MLHHQIPLRGEPRLSSLTSNTDSSCCQNFVEMHGGKCADFERKVTKRFRPLLQTYQF